MFRKDLEDGEEFERIVLHILESEYPQGGWTKNPDKLGVDILSRTGLKVEVKLDRMGDKTGNLFIEVECNGKPSGIKKYEEDGIDVLAYGYKKEDSISLFLINVRRLIGEIDNNSFRIVKGGDGWRAVGVLIPIGYLLSQSIISLHYAINCTNITSFPLQKTGTNSAQDNPDLSRIPIEVG